MSSVIFYKRIKLPGKKFSNAKKHKLSLLKEDNKCCFCQKELDCNSATIEHTVPNIVRRLSFGKIQHKDCLLKLSCGKCNHKRNQISSWIASIVLTNDTRCAKKAARRICDLVRVGFTEQHGRIYFDKRIGHEI